MRFSLAEAMCEPAQYVPIAKAAEEAGFHAYTLPESLAYPKDSDSKYPYTPDGDRRFLEDKPFLDPFCLASALAMVTERLRFHTFVVKLPVRHPLLIAKQTASVAAITGDRFSLGVGLSPWPEDYRLCDVAWERRGTRMDEMMTIIRGLLAGGYYQFEGECFRVEPIKICPVPSRPVPLLVGGHSDAALRRAALLGDGWMHAGGDAELLPPMLATLRQLRADHGLADKPFEIHVISRDGYSLDGIRRLEDLGVSDVIIGFRQAYEADKVPLEKKLSAIRRYGDNIISKA